MSDFYDYQPAHPLSFKISSPIISSLHVNITLLQDIKLKAPGRKALQMEFLPSPRFPLLENWLPIHARSGSQCGESGDNCSWFNSRDRTLSYMCTFFTCIVQCHLYHCSTHFKGEKSRQSWTGLLCAWCVWVGVERGRGCTGARLRAVSPGEPVTQEGSLEIAVQPCRGY